MKYCENVICRSNTNWACFNKKGTETVYLSSRIQNIKPSFIREILKVTAQSDAISFAGGLPNKDLFPLNELNAASSLVFAEHGVDALQYAATEGYPPLKQWISDQYRIREGLEVKPEQIVITNGSQQAFDLIGKVLLNEGDPLAIEQPGYLGAIQAFSFFRPAWQSVRLDEGGMNLDDIRKALKCSTRLFYSVPNFQNPTGLSHPNQNREAVADMLRDQECFFIQDDPYGAIQFSEQRYLSYASLLPNQTILLGSFSKTVVPAFRLGWVVVPEALIDPFLIAKQAIDLHTNSFCQRVLHEYVSGDSFAPHLTNIIDNYRAQKQAMVDAVVEMMPGGVSCSDPEGGMFIWLKLPENISARELLEYCMERKVVFVPGDTFYLGAEDGNELRMNYSCLSAEKIREGVKIMADGINQLASRSR
ncbi:PLP-dependent aminotransferase family protein [Gynuella sunshinyii]|uniref:aminotransferase-like domain-containing protein n=1 Tax=Gynuella sunshinyii TaxID=1445505 RepID=UPI001B80C870|nr:PLP-dependent aminotransferase family protein [Gynuella sunshinyii]